MAIPLLFLVTPETPQYAYLFGAVFGFAMGADYMLIPLMAADRLRSAIARAGRCPAIVPQRHDRTILVARPRSRGCASLWGGYGTRCGSHAGSRAARRDRASLLLPQQRDEPRIANVTRRGAPTAAVGALHDDRHA